MKKTIKYLIILSLLFALTSCQTTNFVDKMDNKTSIEIDRVSFGEGELMEITGENGQIIAYYERFNNPSYEIASIRLFDTNKNLIYSIVPLMENRTIEIHVKNNQNNKAKIEMEFKLIGFGSFGGESTVNFYNKSYNLQLNTSLQFFSVESNISMKENDNILLAKHSEYNFAEVDESPLYVDADFLYENREHAICWSMIVQLLEEITASENAKNQNNNMNNDPFNNNGFNNHNTGFNNGLNTNGTFDHNNNPHDNF